MMKLNPTNKNNSLTSTRPLSQQQFYRFKKINSALRTMHKSLYDFKGKINDCIKDSNKSKFN